MLNGKGVQLIQELNELIRKYSSNDKVRQIIVKEFTGRNMKASVAINILNERLELPTLDIDNNKDLVLLFVFTTSMFKALTYKESEDKETLGQIEEGIKIIPEDYFTPIEIENLSGYKLEKRNDKKEQYTFPNMIKVAEGHWRGIIPAKYLAEIDSGNDIIYNFKTQRDPVIDVYGMKRIKLDKTKVQNIKERLLTGQQFSDELRINLLHDGEDEFIFNEKTGELIYISGTLNIFDGYHRKTANSLAMQENPDLDFNWGLAITNFSEKKAQDFMVQIDKQKPIKQEHTKSLDTSKLGNIVVNTIKDIDTSEFATKIKDSDDELRFDGLTKKSVLAIAIEECYKNQLTNKLQIRPIAKHIANVIDHIIGLYVEEFIINPDQIKEISYINHKNMFAGYVALSEKVYKDKNWEDKVEYVLNKTNFSISNDFWKDNGILETDMKKSTRNGLYKFFKNLS